MSTQLSDVLKKALGHVERREHAEAAAAFTEALRLDPDCVEAYYQRGQCYGWLGEPEKAAEDYTAVLERDPTHAEAYYCRAGTRLRLKQWDKAKADRELAVKYGSENARSVDHIREKYKRAWDVLG